MFERNLVSMAQKFTGLIVDDIIKGPLKAVAITNPAMALTETKLMLTTFLSHDENYRLCTYKSIMILLTLKRSVLAPNVDETSFSIIKLVDTRGQQS